MKLPASSCDATPAADVSAEHVLFAFSDREQALFFPEVRPELAAGGTAWSRLDPESLDAAGWAAALRERRPTVLVTAWSAKPVPADWIDSDDFCLRYVCHVTGTLKKIMSNRLYACGVRATNWGTSINHTVAEHALLLVLALLRSAPRWPASIAEGGWTIEQVARLRTKSLRGRRVGLHGFGGIARDILALLRPFRPSAVLAYSHGVPASCIEEQGAIPCATLEELFAGCEVLIDCESLTPHNRGSVDARILGLLPDDAVFVNVGRAPIIEESALLTEAVSGRLRIGLDVFHKEPLAADSPLLRASGVMVSPHIAGPTWETYRLCGEHALSNLRSWFSAQPLSGEVPVEVFDRMT